MRIGGNLDDVGTTASEVAQRGGEAAADGESFGSTSDTAILDIDTIWTAVQGQFTTLMEDSRARLQTQRDRLAGTDAEGQGWQAIQDANTAQDTSLTLFGEQMATDMEDFRTALSHWASVFTERAGSLKTSMATYDENCQTLATAAGVWKTNLENADNDVASSVSH
jgi:hypothetical protein